MDDSYDSTSLSPTQLLARLHELRVIQEAARDKLQRQRQGPRQSSTELPALRELLRQFSEDPASYRTFQRLLQESGEPCDSSVVATHCADDVSHARIRSDELIDGVSVLNLSQESEFVINSPSTDRSKSSKSNETDPLHQPVNGNLMKQKTPPTKSILKKHIELDDMPILCPRNDFETLLMEKLQMEKGNKKQPPKMVAVNKAKVEKKPFLRRGEGLSRFGLKKDDLVIQNTKSLPWKRKRSNNFEQTNCTTRRYSNELGSSQLPVDYLNSKSKLKLQDNELAKILKPVETLAEQEIQHSTSMKLISTPSENNSERSNAKKHHVTIQECKPTKTWATILTQEQDTFLRQLKQSSYYKNFESPAKSIASDASGDEALHRLSHERETAEQKMFELLESKVTHASFCSESSFIHKFFRNKTDCSGDSTPNVLQRCLASNPQLLQLFPAPERKQALYQYQHHEDRTVDESCGTECVECDRESCSSTSSCCTCRTVEETNKSVQTSTPQEKDNGDKDNRQPDKVKNNKEKESLDQTVTEANEVMKTNMAEMNAKLTATSELLKERLHELEDEIEMFRKENANLAKMREEIDVEKQRFFDERSAYEQKFNEEKILSEYYLAEEREKLAKQKQVYDRYVREMRGRLNKKEKDELTKLKKEIDELKEEYRCKDAKTTTCIARLRNQLKHFEKEKKELLEECEKLKKENRRNHQVNTTTRRLSNIKYLSEINRKLAMMGTNDHRTAVSVDEDVKYKSEEISYRGRSAKTLPNVNRPLRERAKSVPNLTVTSRYAKYFSQRDAMSQIERDKAAGGDFEDAVSVHSGDNDSSDIDYNVVRNYDKSRYSNVSKSYEHRSKDRDINDGSDCEELTDLERIYTEKFKNNSINQISKSSDDKFSARSIKSLSEGPSTIPDECSSASVDIRSKSPTSTLNIPKSPVPPLNLSRSGSCHTLNRSKSPISILSNRSSNASRKSSAIHDISPSSREVSPVSSRKNEEGHSRTSLRRTNLNPTEIKRPDGARELRYPNGNIKIISADGKTSKFMYYNGDVKETFYDEGRVKYFYAETNTYHTTHPDGLEVLQFSDGQVEKRYADGSVEIRLPNGSVRYTDPRSAHVSEEWRFPDGSVLTVSRDGEQLVRFPNGQVEVHAKDHKRREFPDGTVKLLYKDGTSETRYASGRVRIKDRQGALIMDSAQST